LGQFYGGKKRGRNFKKVWALKKAKKPNWGKKKKKKAPHPRGSEFKKKFVKKFKKGFGPKKKAVGNRVPRNKTEGDFFFKGALFYEGF